MSRISLHIGNNYPGSAFELNGCRNDADEWAALADLKGYDTTTVYEANGPDIVTAVEEIVANLGWGDRFLFTYSGHGTGVPDRNGDEVDALDEAIVGADMLLVTDDTLERLFARRRAGSSILYVPDACFSGTGNRFAGVDRWTPGGPDEDGLALARRRFIPPTVFWQGLSVARAQELEDVRPRYTGPASANFLSAASDTEYAWDAWFNGRPNGAFTRTAVDTWTDGVSLAGWHKRIRAALPTPEYPQTPQLDTVSLYRRYAAAL